MTSQQAKAESIEKQPMESDNIKQSGSNEHIEKVSDASDIVELGSGRAVIGSSEEDVPLTQEDIDFVRQWNEDGRGQKVVRKADYRLVPALVLIYLAAFLDRGNIGNARIEGLEKDLGMSGLQYNAALSIFFAAYGTFEMGANVALKYFRPSVWLPFCIVTWGVVSLLATRFFLGMAEAAFFPGAMFILSNWYCRQETQRRMSYLYSSASVAGAFSGLLAFALAKMNGLGGYEGWRWIFREIMEGLATVVLGCAAPCFLYDSIEKSRWLSPDEKRYMRARLVIDRQGRVKGKYNKRYLKQAVTDYKIWITSVIYGADAVLTYGLSFSLPTILKSLHYTSAKAQLLTIPIYVFAAIYTLVIAHFADKSGKRARYILIPYATALAGLAICLATPQPRFPGLVLFAVYLIAGGAYSVVPAIIAWNSNNLSGEWKRGLGIGIQIGITNYFGILGSNIFLANERPRYPLGYGVCFGAVSIACILAIALHTLLKRENARRDAMSLDEVKARYTEEELADMGDKSPLFRYET